MFFLPCYILHLGPAATALSAHASCNIEVHQFMSYYIFLRDGSYCVFRRTSIFAVFHEVVKNNVHHISCWCVFISNPLTLTCCIFLRPTDFNMSHIPTFNVILHVYYKHDFSHILKLTMFIIRTWVKHTFLNVTLIVTSNRILHVIYSTVFFF